METDTVFAYVGTLRTPYGFIHETVHAVGPCGKLLEKYGWLSWYGPMNANGFTHTYVIRQCRPGDVDKAFNTYDDSTGYFRPAR